MHNINVLYCFDNKFWKLAAVSMRSLLQSKNNATFISIYCMVPRGTCRAARRKIEAMAAGFPNCQIIWRKISQRENPFKNHSFSRWSPVIFYRLFAHKVFPHLNRILYLDSDTMIFGDLASLYETDLNNCIMGAVVDCAQVDDYNNYMGQTIRKFQEKYIPNGFYINSGVLLLDLTRRAELDTLPLTEIPCEFACPDQDLINMVFAERIKYLSLRYNFTDAPSVSKAYDQSDFHNARQNYIIYHFYSCKPFVLPHSQHNLHLQFIRTAAKFGWDNSTFIKDELKYQNKKTNIPGLRLFGTQMRLFGIRMN